MRALQVRFLDDMRRRTSFVQPVDMMLLQPKAPGVCAGRRLSGILPVVAA